jgi:enoyl-CoA hydratase/carnithine racemase
LRAIHDLFDRMNRQGTVFIAAINGLALGGGCELALACDIRIMADRELPIGQPEISLGLIPGAGGTQRLTRLLGSGRALELMLEGRPLLPYEAVAAGLVHRVVEPEALMGEALATAERLARRSPTAVRELKRAVYEGASRPLDEGLHIERTGFLATASSPAAQRAMSLYVEDVEALGDVDPRTALDALERWREGSAADMTEEG